MKQIITIQGQAIETYDGSVIQLDYKSNILGEIDKIETCHSYTYAIPNTTQNKALLRLSDVSDTEKKTNQFIPDVELFFNGIKIADGQIYIADVTPDEISIVFLFGMFSALKRIKYDDRKLYELVYKEGDSNMLEYLSPTYAGTKVMRLPVEFGEAAPSPFFTMLVNSESTKSVSDQSGYNFPLCVWVDSLLSKIQTLYKCTISNARKIGDYNNFAMMFKPKLRKYGAFTITATTLKEANDRGTTEEEGTVYPWGYIADNYEIDGSIWVVAKDYNDPITDYSASLKSDSKIKYIHSSVATTVPNMINISIVDENGKLQINWHHEYTPIDDPVHEFNISFSKENYQIMKKGCRIHMQVTALDLSTALKPTNFDFSVRGIIENAEVSGEMNYLDNWSTLPDWSIFDFLTSLAFTDSKRFFINTPTDQNLLQAVSLKEIAANSAKNWSSKIDIDSVKHIYRDDDLAQTNVIQYTKDESDIFNTTNEIYSYYTTKDETLDAKKEFFTSKFRHSTPTGFTTLKNVYQPIEFFCDKEPVPGLVSNISTFGGIWANAPSGKGSTPFMCPEDETRLTKKDDDYLTYTLMNPHKIEAKFHLNVLDLYQIDFTHPIFLAQFGQIYYIEEIKFNAEESEVTLVELKNTDYR